MNQTSMVWNSTHQVWRMNGDGVLSQVDLVLPEEIQFIIPISCGDWFMLINHYTSGTGFWKCTV